MYAFDKSDKQTAGTHTYQAPVQPKSVQKPTMVLEDNRAKSTTNVERNGKYLADNRDSENAFDALKGVDIAQPLQKKANNTGLPDAMKHKVEHLSGYSMDDVNVHFNSDKPVQLNAHAYAQGTDIHIASGKEKFLPHELWHVVQQKQGRVSSTLQLAGNIQINDESGLESEADMMGEKIAGTASDQNRFKPDRLAPNTLRQAPTHSEVIQGAFVVDQGTAWRDTETDIIYQQIDALSDNRVVLSAQNGETFIIALGEDGAWNRVHQPATVTLTPHRDRGYRVDADFDGIHAVDVLHGLGMINKDDLPYSAHGNIRSQEFRDFFADIPSLPRGTQPSSEYLQVLNQRLQSYRLLSQPQSFGEDFNQEPYLQNQDYPFNAQASAGLGFHQVDDAIKSSYQRKDQAQERHSVQSLYESQYLTNFNDIVRDPNMASAFTQTQQSEHWLTTLGPTLDVNHPPTIGDRSAGTDYKAVYSVFKNFLEELSDNPDFIGKTGDDTDVFLNDEARTGRAIDAHKEALLDSSNKKKSKEARSEGNSARKRKTLHPTQAKQVEQAHASMNEYLSGGDPQFATSPAALSALKIAYLFYIKLTKRTISNILMIIHTDHGVGGTGLPGSAEQIQQILNRLFGYMVRLHELQSQLYGGSTESASTESSSVGQASASEEDGDHQAHIPLQVQQLAQANGVLAQYGGSSGNNCLIFAIAGAFGNHLSDEAAAEIRNWLNENSAQRLHFTRDGQLPMLPALIQEITNRLIAMGATVNGSVTVVSTEGNFNAQGAVGGDVHAGNVLVILYGGHYYFTHNMG